MTACQDNQRDSPKTTPELQISQTIDDSQADIDLIQETLISYLADCWGYKKDTHKFIFDEIIELQSIEYSVFKIYSSEDEYVNSFAISLDDKKVYLLGENGEWAEDINPELWSKW